MITERNKVYQTANFAMVEAYWNIGKSTVSIIVVQNVMNTGHLLSQKEKMEDHTCFTEWHLPEALPG